MPISEFYPFKDNQKVTAAQWNELFLAIQTGQFFLDTDSIAADLNSLAKRVEALEIRMDDIESVQAFQRKRQQIVAVAGQVRYEMEDVPRLDSEWISLNGQVLSKTGIPASFTGDYTLDLNVITLNPAWEPLIKAGDIVVISYEFEVNV